MEAYSVRQMVSKICENFKDELIKVFFVYMYICKAVKVLIFLFDLFY